MSRGKMRAALLHGIRDLRIEEVGIPEPGQGEILAKVRAATTCGTDAKIFQRGYVGKIVSYPMPFGHEWAGDVEEAGPGVELGRGTRIRAGNTSPCYRCEMCRRRRFNLCGDRTWLWGAFAEYIRVPENIARHNLQIIPRHLSYEEAAIAEPLACVLHGADRVGIGVGDSVAILGLGPIGLLWLQVAKISGASRVMAIDVAEGRLRAAEKFGADAVIDASTEDPIKRIRDEAGGHGADVVIEAVGSPQTWMQAFRMASRGGKVLEFGGCPPGTSVEFGTEPIHYDEITVMGSFHAVPEEFDLALRLIASGTIKVGQLITRRMPLAELNRAFEILATSKEDIKIAIEP